MATFTPDQIDTLKIVLGYASMPNLLTTELSEARSPAIIDRAIALLDELGEIDGQLSAARQDSMAKQVGQLSLSYSQHVSHLKSEGSRLMKELSHLLGISIAYNKYGGRSISVANYW
ncbi:hypothetical protein IQ268_08915 [Oculatella sp. LEGE 06141]|uniref:hypothetical protein n=1 Tax=Oculatella sp. LEGE 06141 TaxID=1828648 RepID=UPI0018812D37|nr:hypothetical protein [Oculatella sp. LEGE 06141]MBE9178679.1 hypothetical protein [Oculatella sp. LEGE 06141]